MISATIKRFEHLLEIIPPLLLQVPAEDFCAETAENKWNKKEVLGHLVDSAANNHQRIIRAQYEQTPLIAYDSDKWVTHNAYRKMETRHVIDFWIIYNHHLLALMKSLPEDMLSKTCHTGGEKPVDLKFVIDDYLKHLEHHLKQIADY